LGLKNSDSSDQANGHLYELFYDYAIAGLDVSVGKKRAGIGVGYAYRPMDMIQQEQRQTLRSVVVEGVPLISVERFSETGNAGLIYVNHLQVNEDSTTSGDEEWAIKGYKLIGDTDLQWLVHYDQQRQTSAAAGFSWVGDEAVELHASMRLQGEYESLPTYNYDLITQTAIETSHKDSNGLVALLGLTWTFRNGTSVIAEYWRDTMAPDQAFWDSVISDLHYIKSGGVVNAQNAAQIASLNQRIDYGYSRSNFVQNNLFVRCSYDGQWADPSVDILYHPDDQGYAITLRAEREFSQSQRLGFGIRQLGGGSDTLMGNVGESQQVYISWEYSHGL
jgi:hypothetical protein